MEVSSNPRLPPRRAHDPAANRRCTNGPLDVVAAAKSASLAVRAPRVVPRPEARVGPRQWLGSDPNHGLQHVERLLWRQ